MQKKGSKSYEVVFHTFFPVIMLLNGEHFGIKFKKIFLLFFFNLHIFLIILDYINMFSRRKKRTRKRKKKTT